MAWWGNSTPVTYADHVNQMGREGDLLPMVELMSEYTPLIDDAIVLEANDTASHRGLVRTGLPAPTWRKLNGGVNPTKSSSAPVTDTMGNLEAFAEVDKDIADLNGNAAMFRLGEAAAHVEGMTQEMEDVLFYGEETTPEKFIGLTPRFDDMTTPQNKTQILSAGGSTAASQQSVWFVTWDPRVCHMIFPKGSSAGLQRHDDGEQTAYTSTGARMQIYRERFKWQAGLHLKDWRYIVRLCNIEGSVLEAGTTYKLVDLLIKASHKVRRGSVGRTVIYCTEAFSTALDIEAANKTNVNLVHRQYAGEEVLHFRKYPIRVSDALLATEGVVS